MKTVLLTGGTGFIGRWTVGPLVDQGWRVHLVGRKPPSTGSLPTNSIFHSCDLQDTRQVEQVMAEVQPSHLLHLGWYTEHGKFWTSEQNLDCVAASLNLVRSFQSHGGERCVLAGSCAEYDWSHGLCDEFATATTPRTLYGIAKNSLREILQSHSAVSGLSWAWGRIFFLYGPNEDARRFVPSLSLPLMNGQPARCNFGAHRRDFLHVADVAEAFVQLLESTVQGPVNIASGIATTLGDVARTIAEELQGSHLLQIENRAATPENPAVIAAETKRLRDDVGWRPRYTLQQGLQDVLQDGLSPRLRPSQRTAA